jgi:hypothetical protein
VIITPHSIPIRNKRAIFLFPTVSYLSFVTRRQAGSVLRLRAAVELLKR